MDAVDTSKGAARPSVLDDADINRTSRPGYRRGRNKSDWSGPSMSDVRNAWVDYIRRSNAERKLERMMDAARLNMHLHVNGCRPDDGFEVRAQLTPLYTTYPATPAAFAAVGLTAFLEYAAISGPAQALKLNLSGFLDEPTAADLQSADPKHFKQLGTIVCGVVEKRLVLLELSKLPHSSAVEVYRLFAASLKNLRAPSVRDIVAFIVLYGDLLPEPRSEEAPWDELHETTVRIAQATASASQPFQSELERVPVSEHLELGSTLRRELVSCSG